ncbi:MAG: hypothetical protein FJ160_04120 [Gammaproteobacteria bacterium]|nr:hypothetical protein [Gammaproteobacteria bacterium]
MQQLQALQPMYQLAAGSLAAATALAMAHDEFGDGGRSMRRRQDQSRYKSQIGNYFKGFGLHW